MKLRALPFKGVLHGEEQAGDGYSLTEASTHPLLTSPLKGP